MLMRSPHNGSASFCNRSSAVHVKTVDEPDAVAVRLAAAIILTQPAATLAKFAALGSPESELGGEVARWACVVGDSSFPPVTTSDRADLLSVG